MLFNCLKHDFQCYSNRYICDLCVQSSHISSIAITWLMMYRDEAHRVTVAWATFFFRDVWARSAQSLVIVIAAILWYSLELFMFISSRNTLKLAWRELCESVTVDNKTWLFSLNFFLTDILTGTCLSKFRISL